ncbi:hypothetical protein FOCC_FOCC011030 [Frankliniella occidentalis]|nr:hypothetical protein FOCC_FOCC011030 [Frankliniella occidentalis]
MMLQIPRQTVDRWKKVRLEGHLDDEFSGDKSTGDKAQDNSRDATNYTTPTAPDFEVTNQETEDFQEASRNSDNDNVRISDSGGYESDTPSESGDSTGQIELSWSDDGNVSSAGNSDFVGEFSDESEVDSNCGDNIDPFEVDSLYPGSEKTKDKAIFEMANILKLYVTSLLAPNVMPRSVYHLLQYVNNFSLPLNETEHYYCRPSLHPVESKSSCACCDSVDIGVFYELPLEEILKFLFEQRGHEDLIDTYSEKRVGNENISDVVDASKYQRVWSGLSNKYKLTLILNTDGVSLHSSSKAKF